MLLVEGGENPSVIGIHLRVGFHRVIGKPPLSDELLDGFFDRSRMRGSSYRKVLYYRQDFGHPFLRDLFQRKCDRCHDILG